MKDLFDSNAVYFIAYFVVMAAFGQYMILRRIADFIDDVKSAFRRARTVLHRRQKQSAVVDVEATETFVRTARPEIKFKVDKVACEKHLAYSKQQNQIDSGMHDLTSKFHRKSTVK